MTAQALHSPPNQDAYPVGYRSLEVSRIEAAVRAGECVAVVGLSGAGKSNLLQFLAQRARSPSDPVYVLVDGNRLSDATPAGLLGLMRRALVRAWPHDSEAMPLDDGLDALDEAVTRRLSAAGSPSLCFLLDLSQWVDRGGGLFGAAGPGLLNNLRALRDGHKFRLTPPGRWSDMLRAAAWPGTPQRLRP
jgi:energy-coupling factor transporter ATP-binding protein EcfA2